MEQPKISVIISTYNRCKKLKRAVKSVLNQTFKEFELIIVDDCSTDKTEKYCRKLEQEEDNVLYVRLDKNYGQHGRVKNEGMKRSQADLIAYLDDDNEYLIDHLQALYNEIKRAPMVDIVYGDRWVVDESGEHEKRKGISSPFDPGRLMIQNYIDTSDVLVKKKALIDVGGWDEKLPKFADWNLWVRLTKARKVFLHVPKLLSNYYMHAGMNQIKQRAKEGEPGGFNPKTGLILPTFDPDDVPIYADQETFEKEKNMKVAIYTLTYDRLDYTKQMFESLSKNAGYEYDHYVVDNGSKDGTEEWLTENQKKYNIKKVIFNKENRGISEASNQALDEIGEDYDLIIKIDNDCLIESENIIKEIVEVYRRSKQLVLSPNVEGLIDSAGGVPRVKNGYIGKRLFGFVQHIGGIFAAAPAEVYKDFRWEEKDFLHGEQDYIFSQWCVKNKYVLAYYENLRVRHIDSTEGQKKRYPKYFERRKEEKVTRYKNEEK